MDSKGTEPPKFNEQEIIKLIRLDFELINDAVRRLREGTCCLKNNDELDSARHLLNQTATALEFHVDIEERIFKSFSVAPERGGLPDKFFEKMKAEHQQLKNILLATKRELEEQHPIAFQAVLRTFSETLERHTELELTIPFLNVLKQLDPTMLSDIQGRVNRGYVD